MNMGNMDLNSFTKLSDEERQAVVDYLHPIHVELEANLTNENVTLTVGLEQVLQGLGAEGYEFS